MAHYALLSDETPPRVIQVIVGRDEDDLADGVSSWEEYYGERLGGRVVRTSYNTLGGQHTLGGAPFRYNYAGIGYIFDETIGSDGAFIAPRPFESWILDESTCLWQAPIPYPNDGAVYRWDESLGDWVGVV